MGVSVTRSLEAPRSIEEWAAAIQGVDVQHIIEEPKFCGDGIDGDCQAGDCVIVNTIEALRAYAAQVRQEEREVCAKLLCPHCFHGAPVKFVVSPDPSFNLGWHHPTISPGTVPCKAAAIRQRTQE